MSSAASCCFFVTRGEENTEQTSESAAASKKSAAASERFFLCGLFISVAMLDVGEACEASCCSRRSAAASPRTVKAELAPGSRAPSLVPSSCAGDSFVEIEEACSDKLLVAALPPTASALSSKVRPGATPGAGMLACPSKISNTSASCGPICGNIGNFHANPFATCCWSIAIPSCNAVLYVAQAAAPTLSCGCCGVAEC